LALSGASRRKQIPCSTPQGHGLGKTWKKRGAENQFHKSQYQGHDLGKTSKKRGTEYQFHKSLSSLASNLILRDALSFGTDPDAVAVAVYLQREALSLVPNNPRWSANIASMYYRLGKYPLALAYAENAVKKDPKDLASRSLLAECQDILKQPKKAMENRLACLSIPPTEGNLSQRKAVMEKLAAACAANNDPLRAVYVLSWIHSYSNEPTTAEQRLILQKAKNFLLEALIAEIMARKSGHSVADIESYVTRAPAAPAILNDKPVAPADISKIHPTAASSKTVKSAVQFKPDVTARLIDGPSGVIFHKERGILEWTPPPFSRMPEVSVLFLLTNENGGEETYVHTIRRH
jgi:tetratricopeptide (TPR) repeat protein